MDRKEFNDRLKYLPKDKNELLEILLCRGEADSLALAYLVNELCPDDRTTKHVFGGLVKNDR